MRKTKIICTLGPAVNNEKMLRSLVIAGMDVARFNFSHDTHEGHKSRLAMLRKVAEEERVPVAALMDTKGPEIRLGVFENGRVELKAGETFALVTNEITGNSQCASVSYAELPQELSIGATILLDDGLIELEVLKKTKDKITCRVVSGGMIGDKKGVNVPGVELEMPFISDRDRSDILFAAENGFDFIAASFTRSAEDIMEMRNLLEQNGHSDIRIIAKIENHQGIDNIDDILRVADGIMVARGDLGVEIPFDDLPSLQKLLIKKASREGKIVITATQMLESMIKNPRPTRAEITDIANAIYDGTSAIMLSGETAYGAYPVEAVQTMVRIAKKTESDIDYKKRFRLRDDPFVTDVTNAISHAACTTAMDLDVAAIIAITQTGGTAKMVSRFRPDVPIFACTPVPTVLRQMSMSWGVTPVLVSEVDSLDDLFELVVQRVMDTGYIKNGDLVVITGGVPLGIPGTTNMLKVHVAGDVLLRGKGVNALCACGRTCIALTEEEARRKFKAGDVLVMPKTSNEILDLIKHAAGIVTEEKGMNSHAAVAGLALDIPVITGALNATRVLKDGVMIQVDAKNDMLHPAD